MKIVHIAANAPYNDNWGYQDNLLPKYHKQMGHDVVMITTNTMHKEGKIVETECADYVLEDGVRVIRLRKKKYCHRVLTNLKSRLLVFPYLEEIKPDFIFFHGLLSSSLFDAIKYKKKVNPSCVLVQDNHTDYYNGTWPVDLIGKLIRAYRRHINRRSIRYVDKVFGVTPWRKQYAEDYFGIPQDKTDVLIMGADDSKINLENRDTIRKMIREENGVADSEFLVVTGGKIDKEKNIDLLIEACAEIESVKLLIFGQVKEDIKTRFEELVSKNKNILHIGWVDADKVYNYFLASDLIAFPGSHSVLWEQACACGVPALFKDWEGMHHVCVNGNSEFLYEDSVEEMKKKIKELTENKDKYAAMKKAAEECKTDFFYSEIATRALGQ